MSHVDQRAMTSIRKSCAIMDLNNLSPRLLVIIIMVSGFLDTLQMKAQKEKTTHFYSLETWNH